MRKKTRKAAASCERPGILLFAVVLTILTFLIAACGQNQELEADEDSVSIVFPGEMFQDVQLTREFIEVNRYIDAFANRDGTVTVVMSKDRQQEFLDAYKADVDYNIDYFISELAYLEDVTYTYDFRSMTFYMDGNTQKEVLYELPYFFSLPFENYQQMLGLDMWTDMTVVDAKTGEVLLVLRFPDELTREH